VDGFKIVGKQYLSKVVCQNSNNNQIVTLLIFTHHFDIWGWVKPYHYIPLPFFFWEYDPSINGGQVRQSPSELPVPTDKPSPTSPHGEERGSWGFRVFAKLT